MLKTQPPSAQPVKRARRAPIAALAQCPVRNVLDKVGDKWSVLVIFMLQDTPLRFTALRRAIPDISQRVLTATLRKLEREGLVWRMVAATIPPAVTYGLTPLGQSLLAQFCALADWARGNREAIISARARFDAAL